LYFVRAGVLAMRAITQSTADSTLAAYGKPLQQTEPL
jgi:hypothetical protein